MSPHYFMNKHEGESEESFVERLGEDLENHIMKQDPETIAAMFAEPLMGAGGVIIPPKNYFKTIQPILNKYEIPLIDDEVEDIFEDGIEDDEQQEKAKSKWSQIEALVGAQPRLEEVAKDLIDHFETRSKTQPGKALFVGMSRDICARL